MLCAAERRNTTLTPAPSPALKPSAGGALRKNRGPNTKLTRFAFLLASTAVQPTKNHNRYRRKSPNLSACEKWRLVGVTSPLLIPRLQPAEDGSSSFWAIS